MTIVEAISQALKDLGEPSTYVQIYQSIIDGKYFEFKADEPLAVVRVQLRRHCSNVVIKSAKNKRKYFFSKGGRGKDETFELLDEPIELPLQPESPSSKPKDEKKGLITTKKSWCLKFKEIFSVSKIDTHRMALIECFWMLLGAFLPIITDSLVRVMLLKIDFIEAVSENIKGGEVFLLTSALITPFYFLLYRYVMSDNEGRKENRLPYFGLILPITILSTLAGLFAFSYYRIGLVIKGQYSGNPITVLFDFEFGMWAWGIYFVSLLIWYYASYMNHLEAGDYKKIRKDQFDKLDKEYASNRGE